MPVPERRAAPEFCVACPRRSGTHFAVDTIRNNFAPHYRVESEDPLIPEYGGDSLHLLDDALARRFLARRARAEDQSAFLYWTHCTSLDEILRAGGIADPELREAFRSAVKTMKFIYVFRDARDVAVSHCFLEAREEGYEARRAIAHMAEWAESAANWRRHGAASDVDVLYISYELLKHSHEDVVRSIGAFLGLEPADPIRTATIRADGSRDESLAFTTRKFRKGVVGDHANYFGEEETRYYEAHCRALYEPHLTLADLNDRALTP